MASVSMSPDVWTPQNVADHIYARYVVVAGITLMIWTHLTTLDKEAAYIWSKDGRVTLNKVLFAIVRYFTTVAFGFHGIELFLPRPSFEVCRRVCIFVGASTLGLIGVCDVILLLRTWAIYNRTRKSLICLVILLAITHLPTLVIGAVWMTTFHIGPSGLYPIIPGCFLKSTALKEFWPITAPSILYNTVLSGASMYKIWSYHRTHSSTPLMSLFIRDGMAYYVIILTVYLCNGFFLFHPRLVVITIDGQFITWAVAVACAQMQLSTAVYHVPAYVATYYQQSTIKPPPHHRPGVETLIFGGTAIELEHRYKKTSTENEMEQGERYNSHATNGLATPAVHLHGKQTEIVSPSAAWPLSPQYRRANSLQEPPLHSPWHIADIDVHTSVPKEEGCSTSSTGHVDAEPHSRLVTRTETPSSRTIRSALGFNSNSKHNWALARPTRKKKHHIPSQAGILLHDMCGVPSPDSLGVPSRGPLPRSASESNLRVEVQVEHEHDESGVLPMASSLGHESNRTLSVPISQDGGIMESRIGVWR